MGVCSYLAFGTQVNEIVILNLPQDKGFTIVVQLLYMFNIMGSFCTVIQPLFQLFEKRELDPAQQPSAYQSEFYRCARRLMVAFLILGLSIVLDDI